MLKANNDPLGKIEPSDNGSHTMAALGSSLFKALWLRYWHCLWYPIKGLFTGKNWNHCMIDAWDDNGQKIFVGCTCGKTYFMTNELKQQMKNENNN